MDVLQVLQKLRLFQKRTFELIQLFERGVVRLVPLGLQVTNLHPDELWCGLVAAQVLALLQHADHVASLRVQLCHRDLLLLHQLLHGRQRLGPGQRTLAHLLQQLTHLHRELC